MDTANAYIDGWYAEKQGESLRDCPFTDRDMAAAWIDGWHDASQSVNSYRTPDPHLAGWG